MKSTSRVFCILTFCILASYLQSNTYWSVIHSSPDEIRLKVESKGSYAREIEAFHCLIGLPDSQIPEVEFTYSIPLILNDTAAPSFPLSVTWLQFQLLKGLQTGTLVISPFTLEGIAYEEVIVTIPISGNISTHETSVSARITSFLNTRVINWKFAKHWIKPIQGFQPKFLDIPSYTVNVVPENTDYIMIGPAEYEINLMPLMDLRINSFDDPLNTIFSSTLSGYLITSDLSPTSLADFSLFLT